MAVTNFPADEVGKRIAKEYGIDTGVMANWCMEGGPDGPTKLTVELTMFPTPDQVDKFLGRAS